MFFQKHSFTSILVIAFALDFAGAMRVQPSKTAAKNELNVQRVGRPLFDVTDLVNDDAFPRPSGVFSGYKCCCDKKKDDSTNDDKRGINHETRANYCAIAYGWWCGGVKVRNDTVKAHDHLSTGGTCEITPENVQVLVQAVKKEDYCKAGKYSFKDMQVELPAAKPGDKVKAPCLDNSEGEVECLAGTPTRGYWGAVKCGGQPTWCPSVSESEDGAPNLPPAEFGEDVFVNCFPKKESVSTTRCGESGWNPPAFCFPA